MSSFKLYRSMNTLRRYTLSAGLLLGAAAADSLWAAETAPLSAKVQTLQEQDPAGLIMTLTAVLVVFLALTMLVLVFKYLGRLFTRSKGTAPVAQAAAGGPAASGAAKPSPEALVAISLALRAASAVPSGELAAAIAMALASEREAQHDHESYVLTIRRRPTQWNARIQGLQRYNH